MKKYLLLASLVLSGLCVMSCGDDGDDKGGQNVCATENEEVFVCSGEISNKKVCKKIDGILNWESTDEGCTYGCDASTGKCKSKPSSEPECTEANAKEKCGENKICSNGRCTNKGSDNEPECTEANALEKCGENKVCNDGHCDDAPKTGCENDSECGAKICEGGSCVDPQCTETVCASDNKTLKKCENGRVTESACEGTCYDNDCRDADYCTAAIADVCLSRTDGKTVCDNDKKKCDTMACANADCKTGTKCVLGVCVPDGQDNETGNTCDPNKFVSFCDDEGKIVECYFASDKDGVKTYKIRHNTCNKNYSCRSFKSGVSVESACVIMSDMCSGSPTSYDCDEKSDYYEYTHYSCTKSTNNETISVIDDTNVCSDANCSICGSDAFDW